MIRKALIAVVIFALAAPVVLAQQRVNTVAINVDDALVATSETLLTFSSLVTALSGNTDASSTGTSYAISTNKTLRIQRIAMSAVTTGSQPNKIRVRLRTQYNGACTTSSPILATATLTTPAALQLGSFVSSQTRVDVQDADFPAAGGRNVCLSAIAAVGNATITVTAAGYEY